MIRFAKTLRQHDSIRQEFLGGEYGLTGQDLERKTVLIGPTSSIVQDGLIRQDPRSTIRLTRAYE